MDTTYTCSYCHQTKFDASAGVLPSGLSLEGEDNFLRAEAHRLELLILQIHAQRKALLRRLNAIQSTTRVFPPEILSLVFQNFCAYYPPKNRILHIWNEEGNVDYEHDEGDNGSGGGTSSGSCIPSQREWYDTRLALRLSSVSSQWRELAHSTLQLWGTIHSNPADDITMKNDTSLISLALERSGRVPLRAEFDFSSRMNPVASTILFDPSIDKRLKESLSRVVELNLVSVSKKWLEVVPKLSQVSKLAIVNPNSLATGTHPEDSELCLSNSPFLRSLVLESSITRVRLPSVSNITILNLRCMHPGTCIQLLLQCPKLVVFHAEPHLPQSVESLLPALNLPITFEDLRIFNWIGSGDPWDSFLLRSVHLPVLVKLMLLALRHMVDYAQAETFFSGLSPTLRSLRVGRLEFDYLPHTRLQALINLTLESSEEEFILAAIDRLGKTVDREFLLFPRLKKIRLNRLEYRLSHGCVEKLVEMCGRRVEKGIFFCLEIDDLSNDFVWSDLAKRRLRELQPALTVTLNGDVCFPTSLDTPEI